eukprot:COSAG02_NODE_851_length_16536_cov_6.254000_1_plen_944_part_00
MPASSSSSASSDSERASILGGTSPISAMHRSVRLSQEVTRTLAQVPLFAGLEHHKLQKIGATSVQRQVVSGEVVIQQGEKGTEMFVVESGRLQASVIAPDGTDVGVVKTYSEGEYFGELALMSDDPRAATITAMSEGTLLVLERQVITQLLQDLHGSALSTQAAAEALDVEFQKAIRRRSNRRGAVVQQKDVRTGVVKLASTSNSNINPLRRVWANEMERARETDMRAVSTMNKLDTLGELHAAALAGDLPWIQKVLQPEVEAAALLKRVEPELDKHRKALDAVVVAIEGRRLEIDSATASLAQGRRIVDKLYHQKSLLAKQLEKCRSTATAAIAHAKTSGSGLDAERARLALGTVNQLQERMDDLVLSISYELAAGDVSRATQRLQETKDRLNLAEHRRRELKRQIATTRESVQHARGVVQYISSPDRLGRTAVHFAVDAGHLNVLVYLHKSGAKMDNQDEDGRNPLHVAVIRDHHDIVEYLLAQAVRNLFVQTDKQGASALFAASYQGNPSTVGGIIMKYPHNLNIPAADGTTPLFVACEYGHLEAIRVLIVNRADLDARRQGGFTPLYIACQQRHNDVVGLLLASKADVDHATDSGLTAFTACCHGGALHLAQMLAEGGAAAERPTCAGRTACWVAAHSGRLKVLRWLVEDCGVDVERPDNAGVTPLQTACENAHVAVVEYICSLPCLPAVALRRSRLLRFVTDFKNIEGSEVTAAERAQAARGSHRREDAVDFGPAVVTVRSKSKKHFRQSRGNSILESGSEDEVGETAGLHDGVIAVDADGRPLSRGLTPESQQLLRISEGDRVADENSRSYRKPRLGHRRGAVVLEEFLAQSVLAQAYRSEDAAKLTGTAKQKRKQQLMSPVTPPITFGSTLGRSLEQRGGEGSPWAMSHRSSSVSGLISPAASKRAAHVSRHSSREVKRGTRKGQEHLPSMGVGVK